MHHIGGYLSKPPSQMTECKNAILVCAKCKNIMFAPGDVWEHANGVGEPLPIQSRRKLTPCVISQKAKWEFEDTCRAITGNSELICSSCYDRAKNSIKTMKDFMDKQSLYLIDHFDGHSAVVANIEKDISVLREEQFIEPVPPELSKPPRRFPEQNKLLEGKKLRVQYSMMPRFQDGFASITICSTFRITAIRQYGAINDLRLGWQTPDAVPSDELDGALATLGRLIICIGNMIHLDVTDIKVGAFLQLKLGDDEFTNVEAESLKKPKTRKLFNRQIEKLFVICNQIFSCEAVSDTFIVPHSIKLSDKTIGERKYTYDNQKPYVWTWAMKTLLTDFKFLQRRMLQYSIATNSK